MSAKLFQYAIIWHPTDKQVKEHGMKSEVLVEPTSILATDERKAAMAAAMEIPTEKREELDQIEIVIRPF